LLAKYEQSKVRFLKSVCTLQETNAAPFLIAKCIKNAGAYASEWLLL
jgi:hypothetical protein